MKRRWRGIIRRTPLYFPLRTWRARLRGRKELRDWEQSGRTRPPPHAVKQEAVRAYARQYGARTLVETGTYFGDMVAAMKRCFDRIFSIELSPELHHEAQRRFARCGHIELIRGDSGVVVAHLLDRLTGRALFWLDGHYSAGDTARGEEDTPVLRELGHIFHAEEKGHVVLIDDAHCFGVDPAYPTLDQLRAFIETRRPDLEMTVEDDIIRITPRNG